MSKENVKKFYDLTKEDKEMLEKLGELESTEEIVAAAKEKGFEFTAEDHEKYMDEMFASTALSDDEVEEAAGGFSLPRPKVPKMRTYCNTCGWKSDWVLVVQRNKLLILSGLHTAQKGHVNFGFETAMKPAY